MTGVLNFFPQIRVNSPFAAIIPTCCIMLLGVFKEFVGEYKRYKDDKRVNAILVKRLTLDGEEQVCLADIKVGDIVKIYDGE